MCSLIGSHLKVILLQPPISVSNGEIEFLAVRWVGRHTYARKAITYWEQKGSSVVQRIEVTFHTCNDALGSANTSPSALITWWGIVFSQSIWLKFLQRFLELCLHWWSNWICCCLLVIYLYHFVEGFLETDRLVLVGYCPFTLTMLFV